MSLQPLKTPIKYAEANTDIDAEIGHAAYESYSAIVEEDPTDLDEDAVWLREQRLHHKTLHWLCRPSVVMVGVLLFLLAFATLAAEGTRQMVLFKLACNSLAASSNTKTCDPAETQVLVLSLQQAFSVARGVATIVALGKVGPLSDKYGRKVFFVVVVVSVLVGSYMRYLLTATYPTLQFGAMVVTEIVLNCMGGGMALLTLANCYVSDIAEPAQRTYYLGINIASFFVGMSTGPLAGNLVLSFLQRHHLPLTTGPHAEYGPGLTSADFAPLRLELVLLLAVLFFIIAVMPESRGETARRMSRSLLTLSQTQRDSLQQNLRVSKWRQFWDWANFLRPMRVVFYPKDCVHRLRHKSIVRTRIAVILLVSIDCLAASAGGALGEVFFLYGVYRFQWTAVDIGRLMAITCSSRAFVLVVLSPVLTYNVFQKTLKLKPNKRSFDKIDFGVVILAFFFEIVGQIMLGTSKNGAVFLASLVVSSIASLAMPAINSAIIKFYPESMIGEVYGGMAIIKNIFLIVAPVLVLALYKVAVAKWDSPQVIFLGFAGLFTVLAGLVTFVIITLNQVEALEAEAQQEYVL